MSFGRDIARAAGESMLNWIAAAFILGVSTALIVAYGAPWLWSLIKPWLHTITA